MMEPRISWPLKLQDTNDDEFSQVLAETFFKAKQRVPAQATSVLVSVTVPIALSVQDLYRRVGVTIPGMSPFFWASPHRDLVLVGLGKAETLIVSGQDRFQQLKDAVAKMRSTWVFGNLDKPKFLGGFSFQPGTRTHVWAGWEDGLFILPRYLFEVNAQEETSLTVSQAIHLDEDPHRVATNIITDLRTWLAAKSGSGDAGSGSSLNLANDRGAAAPDSGTYQDMLRQEWESLVQFATERIKDGGLRKVVLARQQSLRFKRSVSMQRVLQRLIQRYPESFVFSVSNQFGCFTGASPERLVRVYQGAVDVDALAGTIARGVTVDDDERLGQLLLNSVKDRSEHSVVVERIRSEIANLVLNITVPQEPMLKKLANVQHLFTPIRGIVRGNESVVDFVARLHPTPAVAGEPREEALKVISDYERLDRGWYASPIGWFSPTGDGEFSVALRSALIQGDKAYLFAGAGIMADSDPSLEWEETQLKLQAMQMALMEE